MDPWLGPVSGEQEYEESFVIERKRPPTVTPYERWIEQEGIPVSHGHGLADVTEAPRGAWQRMGGSGAYIQLDGMEGITGLYVAEIPPGGALNPERHIYEEVICVLRGNGLTEVWQEGGSKQVFEWHEGSLFAPPLNAWHRLFNGRASEPAIFLALTNAPLIMDLYRRPDFVYECPFEFDDRYTGQDGFFAVGDNRYQTPWGGYRWETNFIPDVRDALIDASDTKAAGGRLTQFEISGNSLIGHISEWPAGRYHKAHYHGAGAVLLGLKSKGYVLMWPNSIGPRPYEAGRGDEVVRVDWGPSAIYCPPNGWFHQHFNTGAESARHLALRTGSNLHPLRFAIAAKRFENGTTTSIREGGTLVEYEDEDPAIRRMYEAALVREGVECRMPVFA